MCVRCRQARDAGRRELRRTHLLHGDALHEQRVILRLRADRRDALGVGLLERASTLRARAILTLGGRRRARARRTWSMTCRRNGESAAPVDGPRRRCLRIVRTSAAQDMRARGPCDEQQALGAALSSSQRREMESLAPSLGSPGETLYTEGTNRTGKTSVWSDMNSLGPLSLGATSSLKAQVRGAHVEVSRAMKSEERSSLAVARAHKDVLSARKRSISLVQMGRMTDRPPLSKARDAQDVSSKKRNFVLSRLCARLPLPRARSEAAGTWARTTRTGNTPSRRRCTTRTCTRNRFPASRAVRRARPLRA